MRASDFERYIGRTAVMVVLGMSTCFALGVMLGGVIGWQMAEWLR